MAEGRMLKKKVSTSKKLMELKTDSARLLWTWLLPQLDIEGKFSADPDIVKGSIVPRLKHFTSAKVSEYLLDMARNNLITIYEINNDKYLKFNNFMENQTLRTDREAKSVIPEPGDKIITPGVPLDNARNTPTQVKLSLSEDKLKLSEVEDNIISDLNIVLGTAYKTGISKTNDLIKARLNEGFTIDDFKTVHRKMLRNWGADSKMCKYLRPITLYSTKFESYLNSKESTTILTESGVQAYLVGREWLRKYGVKDVG